MDVYRKIAIRLFFSGEKKQEVSESPYLKELRQLLGTMEETPNVKRLGALLQNYREKEALNAW